MVHGEWREWREGASGADDFNSPPRAAAMRKSTKWRQQYRTDQPTSTSTGMYDAEARGNRLLERARLTQSGQRLILVRARYSLNFDDIADSMVMQYPEFAPGGEQGRHHSEQGLPAEPGQLREAKDSRVVQMETLDEEAAQEPEDEAVDEPVQDDEPDEPDDPVLTVTAKKLSGLRLGRKFTSGPKKDTAALKEETHCQAGGEKG